MNNIIAKLQSRINIINLEIKRIDIKENKGSIFYQDLICDYECKAYDLTRELKILLKYLT